MAIDPHYIPAFSIEDVILDKDTGATLSGGKVYFEQDNQRGTLKPVYQITGTSPNYTFVPLPNPVILSSIGTFEDALSNPVIPYFYPYDAELNPEYYYIKVLSSEDVPQFTREAQPFLAESSDDAILSAITNEISNPQFAVVNFDTTTAATFTYTLGAGDNQILDMAPDWGLVVSVPSSGTVTVAQLKPTGSLNILTNPATILNITSTGLSKLQLTTRIYGSPNLWGSGFLSTSFVAKTYSGTPVILNMYYSQSNGTVIDQQLASATLPSSGNYEQFNGTATIPISNSSDTFPNGYIDIYFDIPLGVQIDITSIMVAYSVETAIPELHYDQESVARQIDHLYHYAYPIVPIGSIISFWGFDLPLHYLDCTGAAINRIAYQKLFQALTKLETVNLSTGVATFTVANGLYYAAGTPIEGTGIAPGTTILSISGNIVTISAVATTTGASQLRFFSVGNGDGATTFNLPNLVNYTIAGAFGNLLATAGVGSIGGAASVSLTANNLPAHTHDPGTGIINFLGGGTGLAAPGAGASLGVSPTTGNNTTTHTDVSILQPTRLVRFIIRYQ